MPEANPHEASIRQALSSEEFGAALDLWAGYRRDLEMRASRDRLTLDEITEALELCSWTILTARCSRSHLQRRWNEAQASLRTAEAYRTTAR